MSQQVPGTAQDPADSGSSHAHRRAGSDPRPGETSHRDPGRPSSSRQGRDQASEGPRPDVSRDQPPMLPPLHRAGEFDESAADRRPVRSLGVHAILNTSQSETEQPRGVRRSASEMEASTGDMRPISLPPLAISRAPSVDSTYGEVSSPGGPANLRANAPRRILTPRSPHLGRAPSFGRVVGPPDAPQGAYGSPGPRQYALEPGVGGLPPLPTPPAAARSGYGFPPPSSSTPPLQTRSASISREAAMSAAPSPRLSYGAAQAPGAPPSSTAYMSGNTSSMQPYSSIHMSIPPGAGTSPGPGPGGRGSPSFMPISSSGGSNYQILTMPTHKGPVQIPVDVQAASKMADEKRKRNAGASARFRERRKMKEKEATQTINRLEQQLREATEDAEFYRRERDQLAHLVYQSPGGDRHFPRPQSPRRTRVPGTPSSSVGGGDTASGSGSGSYSFSEMSENPRRATDPISGDRNTRRRTTGYNLPHPPSASVLPQASNTYASGFPPIVPAPAAGGQPQALQSGPARYTSALSSPAGPGPSANTNPQIAPRPTAQAPRPPDEDQSWTPTASGGRGSFSGHRQ